MTPSKVNQKKHIFGLAAIKWVVKLCEFEGSCIFRGFTVSFEMLEVQLSWGKSEDVQFYFSIQVFMI